MTDNHPIDQLFKERLGSFEKHPPVGLLDAIKEEMAAAHKIKRMNTYRRVISIAASLLLISLAGWYFSQDKPMLEAEMKATPPVGKEIQKDATVPQNEQLATLALQQPAKSSIHPKKSTKRSKKIDLSSNNGTTASTTTKEDVIVKKEGENKGSQQETSAQQTQGGQKKNNQGYNNNLYTNNSGNQKAVPRGGWRLRAELSPMFVASNQSGMAANTKSVNTISGGMIASYQLSDKFSISSGIRFSQMKQGTHTDYTMAKTSGITYLQPVQKDANITRDVSVYLPAVSSIVYSNGMQTVAGNVFVSDVAQEFKYLEIPIQATYKVMNQQKMSVGVTGGLSTNFLVGNYASVTENGILLSQGNTDNLRDVLYSGSAGIEFGYDLGKNLILTVEPRVKQYLHSISSNDLVNFRPMQLGIFTGIAYSF